MIHMVIPHQTYREKNCSKTDRFTKLPREGYRSTAYCAFKRIHELSDYIVKKYPKASIVVQSDHGLWTEDINKNTKFDEISNSLIDHRLGIFTAVKVVALIMRLNLIKLI